MDLSDHKYISHILEYLETALVGCILYLEGSCEIPYIDPSMPHLIKLHLALRKLWDPIPKTCDPTWNNVGISSYARTSGVQLGHLYFIDLDKITRAPLRFYLTHY